LCLKDIEEIGRKIQQQGNKKETRKLRKK
jgi:hypothetical protein